MMRLAGAGAALVLACSALVGAQGGQRGTIPPGSAAAQRGGRGGVQVMTLTTTAWADGGQIPARYTQAGERVSPPIAWSNVPDGVGSFVLVVHDTDAAGMAGTDDVLHWMLWNIPATSRGLQEAVPEGSELPDGTRQVSATGPFYAGPGAPAAGSPHHYLFELFALDGPINVRPIGASPAETRAAVAAAMAGHVRGKAVMVGLFRRVPVSSPIAGTNDR